LAGISKNKLLNRFTQNFVELERCHMATEETSRFW